MILYFLRHAHAEPAGRDGNDAARRLSARGEAAMRAAAPVWRRLNLRPDVVLSSPLPRALRTAELFVEGVRLARPPVVDERLAPGAGWPDFAQALADHHESRRVMFVGHEPDLSEAVVLLTGASSVRMRKGGLACVEFPGYPDTGQGELAWLLDPDLYESDER